MPLEEIIVGREPADIEKYGKRGTAFLGRHVVGTGFETHVANPVRMDVMRPHVMMIVGKRGSGKCLHGDTLIPLSDGSMVPIRDIASRNGDVHSLDEKLKMVRSGRSEFFEREVDELLYIRLRSGREIKLTPEHPLLTVLGWKQAIDLGIGSRIATPRKIEAFGSERMEECRIKLLAYLLAEGHLGNNFVIFSNMDAQIVNDFTESVRLFDGSLRILEHSKAGCYRVTKSIEEIAKTDAMRKGDGTFTKRKSSLAQWLVDLGIYGKLSKDKFIPDVIFRLPKDNLALFLNRLFSCDGSIYKSRKGDKYLWEISYSSSSKELIHQVRHLLLRFGILSKLRQKKVKCNNKIFDTYELVIGTENILRFIEKIGFFGRKAERQGICIEEASTLSRNPNVDTVPQDIWSIYRPKCWADIGRALGYTTFPKAARESQFYSPSRQKLLQIAEADCNPALKLLAESDVFWDEIIAMEKLEGNFKVYDICVPEMHNFVANDIIVHNSYSGAVIAEEIMNLPEAERLNLSVVMIDTMGIYWSMKEPNDPALLLLKEWKMQPKGFPTQNIVPAGLTSMYRRLGVPFDGTFAIKTNELSAADWALTFGISMQEPLGILLERILRMLKGEEYGIDDIIDRIEKDEKAEAREKNALSNRFAAAQGWGIFSEQATPIDKFLTPGIATVIDISLQEWNVRNLMLGILARKIYEARIAARRQEEIAAIGGRTGRRVPMTWIIMDEAHNFIPSEGVTAATSAMLTLVREGRQPGISTVFITQRPNRLHEDVIAQSDLIIAHRLTSRQDLNALSSVMQTYLLEDLTKSIANMPRTKGAAIILDDNSERLFNIQVRPRQSWHAGGTPTALASTS